MELATIELPRAEARERYIEYRDAVRKRHDSELAQIMRGYRELAKGRQLIDLPATIRAGGTFRATGLPRLAVGRANREWCYVEPTEDGAVTFATKHAWDRASHNMFDLVRCPDGTLPQRAGRHPRHFRHHRAMVPLVPPALRPDRGGLHLYHVLWEAKWERTPRPPGDPALLRHIGGDLYAVLATWDLTELEQAVLARRTR